MVKRAAVSSLGRFRSTRGVVHTPKPKKSGYVAVRINGKNYLLHRLVATAFKLPETDVQTKVNHKDRDTTNNRRQNLELVTPRENMNQ